MLKNATRCIKSQGETFQQDDGDVYIFIILFYMLLYHGLGEYSILIGCRVSIKKW